MEKKELEFTAQKTLRKDAFLRVYHSDKKGVSGKKLKMSFLQKN